MRVPTNKARYLTGLFFFLFLPACSISGLGSETGWEQVPVILQQIIPPAFPKKDFPVTDYAAVGDGKIDCTAAIEAAIDACHSSGGGRVVIPEGVFLSGTIHLKSNVNLHLTPKSTILFSTDPRKYLPVVFTRFEGVECMNYSPFIYAFEQENIAITGSGILDGQAGEEAWWPWKGREKDGWEKGEKKQDGDREKLFRQAAANIPVSERIFGAGHYLRPNFIQPYRCRNVMIDSVTIKRSSMWGIHPVLCENVTIQNVKIISHGPNNDGCDPESSRNVLIRNSYFDTGDDCIAIKSGRNEDGRRLKKASENIIIRDCIMTKGHGGVVIGSEISGDCRNIYVENCTMDSPNLQWALRIKTNSVRGGLIENIYMRDVTVGQVSDAVLRVNFNYEEGDAGQYTPAVRNIHLTNITSSKSRYAFSVTGYERSPVTGLTIENCRFNGVDEGNQLRYFKKLKLKNVYINDALQKSE